jgi:hypothetical protein
VLVMLRAGASEPAVQRAPDSALLANTSETERKSLQVLTTVSVKDLSAKDIAGYFKSGNKDKAPADDVQFGPGIDPKIHQGLQSLAADIAGPSTFAPNTVTQIPLNLAKYGGANGVYRFAIVERKTNPKLRLMVDIVSTTPPADAAKIDLKTHQARVDKFDIKAGSGFGADEMRKRLFAALARLPDSVLARIRGVTFTLDKSIDGPTGEPGHYDPNTHQIHMYNKALTLLTSSADALGADFFTYVITHEVAHAVDFESFTVARVERDRLVKELRAAQLEAKRITIDPNAGLDGDKVAEAKKAKDAAKIKSLQADLNKAQETYNKLLDKLDVAKGGSHSQSKAFKTAAKGKSISKYGETSGVENFAEQYSMYLLDPDLFLSLRPVLHAYFKKTFP